MKRFIPVLVFIYFLFATIYITFPLIFHLKNYSTGLQDELLITWILNWNIFSFTHNPSTIFNGNIFYPYLNTLAFSDTFFTSSLISFFPAKLFGEPLVAYNFTLIFSFTTLGFFTYLFVRFLTKNEYASIISGTLIAFSTYTVSKPMHPQLIGIGWIPLCLLFFLKFIKSGSTKDFMLFCLFLVLQTANSFLPAYFLFLCLFLFISYLFVKKRSAIKIFAQRNVIIISFVVLGIIAVLASSYLKVSLEFDYVRDIRETIHFGNRPEYTFFSSDKSKLKPILDTVFYSKNKGPYFYEGYLGFALIILSVISIGYLIRYRKRKLPKYSFVFLFIAIASYVLSLGPALQWGGRVIKLPFIIPLPYAVLYYVVPGFKGFRNSARWEMLMVFALSILIGLILALILGKKSKTFSIFITCLVCFLVLFEFHLPYRYYQIPISKQFPPVYHYIKTLPEDTSLIELPMYNWNMAPYASREHMRMYYTTLHFKKMVNGASGFSPPKWQEQTYEFMQDFPSKKTIDSLQKMGVTHVIIHRDEYEDLEKNHFTINNKLVVTWSKLSSSIDAYKKLKLIKSFDKDYLYVLEQL